MDDIATDDECAAAWNAFEASWPELQQRRVDRMRVRGYAVACLRTAEQASKDLETASVALLRARKRAERAQRTMEKALEQAELITRVVAADDPEWTAEVAQCLEECFG